MGPYIPGLLEHVAAKSAAGKVRFVTYANAAYWPVAKVGQCTLKPAVKSYWIQRFTFFLSNVHRTPWRFTLCASIDPLHHFKRTGPKVCASKVYWKKKHCFNF